MTVSSALAVTRSFMSEPAAIKCQTELAGAPQVETSGTLYPGLIELHNHPAYNEIPLWDPPQKYTNRKQWRAASDYARKIKTPAAILGNNTDTDYPRAIARFVECKALFGGTTTFAGLAAKDGHNYVGLVRNIEFPGNLAGCHWAHKRF
jgi:5-methylthioadenosine/S-adenosylhomocysteine deaminase